MRGRGRVPPVRQAVVLAGGRGTRLGTLTRTVPKPLLPVGGRPFLEWLLRALVEQGVEEVILAVGYRARAFQAWRGGADVPLAVRLVVEEEPLGTWGAVPGLAAELDPAFLLLNGDTLLDVELRRMREVLEGEAGDGVVALRRVPDAGRYGAVETDGTRVVAFREKDHGGPGWINGGVYLLRRTVAERFAAPGPASVERDVLPALAAEGSLRAVHADGFFLDIGIPATYQAAQRLVPEWWARRYGVPSGGGGGG